LINIHLLFVLDFIRQSYLNEIKQKSSYRHLTIQDWNYQCFIVYYHEIRDRVARVFFNSCKNWAIRHFLLGSSGMNSCLWCVERYSTHEQRHNRVQCYVFIVQYRCTYMYMYMCMRVCEGKKQTPICDEGVAPFSEIRKDKDIKLYPDLHPVIHTRRPISPT